MRLLQVNEIFGPTFQGEGPYAGHHCLFVRLFMCNLECSWCDTWYTWATTLQKAAKHQLGKIANKADECHEMSVGRAIDELLKLWPINTYPTIVVISGGEPMMQQTALMHLTDELHYYGCPVHIETAGTIMPQPGLLYEADDQYVVSPKLASSGNTHSKRYKPKVLRAFRDQGAYFKFVVTGIGDFEEIDQIVKECNIHRSRVMCMPEGTTEATISERARLVKDEVLRRGYGLSLREHVVLWGDKRGH